MSLQPGSSSASEKRKRSYHSRTDPYKDTLLSKRRESFAVYSKEELLEDIPVMKQRLWSESAAEQFEGTIHFRKLLANGHPPIDEVIKADVVPRIVEFLESDGLHQLQFEALWVLTNIASGTSQHKRAVVDHGAVPKLVKLLSPTNNYDDVREQHSAELISNYFPCLEQAVWVLGNIAFDSPCYSDLILNEHALLPLLSLLNPPSPILSMLRITTWTLSNLVRGKPPVKTLMPVLKTLIHNSDEEVVSDACWALFYISDVSSDTTKTIVEAEFCVKLVDLLTNSSLTVIVPVLRTLGNIVAGDDAQTQLTIDKGLITGLSKLLLISRDKEQIYKETCWTISNITAGNGAQIQAIIDAHIIPVLVAIVIYRKDCEIDLKKEVAWAISNATRGSHDQIRYLVDQRCIQALCDLLAYPNSEIVSNCLEGLENILVVGEVDKDIDRGNSFAERVDKCDGWGMIENLKSHDKKEIKERAARIFKTFWAEDDLVEDTDLQDDLGRG
ncbi:Importin subunit alpha-4 [Glycine max]|nr:Importin subunit alpha-4 [Glycine max]KAH1198842.1 Importin subunit alpha-4 [Glycine max]